ncbi:MAG: hypothetical protein AAGG69_10875 [Pseudomonadota bacterium]
MSTSKQQSIDPREEEPEQVSARFKRRAALMVAAAFVLPTIGGSVFAILVFSFLGN